MTEAELRDYIEKYVDDKYFDREKLMKYLSMHQMVGNEIFQYCDKGTWKMNGKPYSKWLDSDAGYYPLYKDSFIDRIPFYFYHWDGELDKNCGTLNELFSECISLKDKSDPDELERLYQNLRYLFYERGISLYNIFNYTIEQTDQVNSGLFPIWVDYLHLCDSLKHDKLMPERLITENNKCLIEAGKEPLIYNVLFDIRDGVFRRDKMVLKFDGVFPCNDEGHPIMEWIGIRTECENAIWCDCEKSKGGTLYVEILPETRVHALGVYDDDDEDNLNWYQVYTGPKRMEFDYESLKYYRKKMGLTQQQVANAIEANVRTYQKWENGETTPDGQNLIRLMNWLDIPDVQEVIKYL
ncbi:MAG: helix-turn-helix transcriptional regulator [Lachnospiraceae bacterium]|nr:helix-turn-helix transcriptional regulator [Lachnospiraceae bacterium]